MSTEYRCPLCTGVHCVQVFTVYKCPLSTGVHSVQVSTEYRCSLCTGVHSVQVFTELTGIHYVASSLVSGLPRDLCLVHMI